MTDDILFLIASADAAAAARDLPRAIELLETVTRRQPDLIDPWKKLAACRRGAGRPTEAIAAIEAALTIEPRDPLALMMKGALLESAGQDAEEIYRAALTFLDDAGGVPPPLARQAERARQYIAAAAKSRTRRLADAFEAVAGRLVLDRTERARLELFAETIAINDTVTVLPGLRRPDFFDPATIRGLPDVARRYEEFCREYLSSITNPNAAIPYVNQPPGAPLDQWRALNGSQDWSAVHLIEGGRDLDAAGTCPNTVAAWRTLPLPIIPGRSPNLMFSILAPHTTIPRHQGVFNARLVVHVPLVIPRDCVMVVGDSAREWVPGHALVFDDTIPHEAANNSDDIRIVLIGDAWHPDLSSNERTALTELMAADKPAAHHGV